MVLPAHNFFSHLQIWEFDAISRAYSRPIPRSTIERRLLLRKLYKTLFRYKTLKKEIELVVGEFLVRFFQKSVLSAQY